MNKVLLVEDDEPTQNIIKYLLKNTCELRITDRGEEAIELIRQNKYELILMDIKLNFGMNGIQTTREIRKIRGMNTQPLLRLLPMR